MNATSDTDGTAAGRAGHTPGPWRVDGNSELFEDSLVIDKDCYVVADCSGPNGPSNARLIAAAPELLEAGRALAKVADDKMATIRETVEAVRVMRAAIAKAEGIPA